MSLATWVQRHIEQVHEEEEAGDGADYDPGDCARWRTGVLAAVGGCGDGDCLVAAGVCVDVGVGVGVGVCVEEGVMVVVIVYVGVDIAEVEGCCETR